LGDYSSAPSQDTQQLRDGGGVVPARSLPQEAEAGIAGSGEAGSCSNRQSRPAVLMTCPTIPIIIIIIIDQAEKMWHFLGCISVFPQIVIDDVSQYLST